MTPPEPTYPYRVGYLHGGKIKEMTIQAETREHARLLFWEHVEDMQAFTESGPEVFNLLSVEQIHTNPTTPQP